MKIESELKKLRESSAYKDFLDKHPDAFFSTAFLILEKNREPKPQLDFFIPSEEKLSSFEHPYESFKVHDDKISNLQEQETNIKIDIDNLFETVEGIIRNKSSNLVPNKIIAVLSKDLWNLTCMDSMLGMLRLKVNAKTTESSSPEKANLMDFARIKGGDLGKKYDKAKEITSSEQD